ncbi:hypothetical protein [Streptomyces sp. NPDC058308]|uniref:hypothetical protein n=1 Tax=Streptomyces sp. NPDC058308 TaxID=3346440 RepID=UPI0036EAB62C
MFHRTTPKASAGRRSERPRSGRAPHWTPDPVSRSGATFYAFAGAALWEAADITMHYVKTEAVPALCDVGVAVTDWVTRLIA